MNNMTREQKMKCHRIIHGASALAALTGGGLAQLPMGDAAALSANELQMIIRLGRVFGIELTEAAARAAIASEAATILGRTISKYTIGWIPVYGNVCNAVTASTVTESIGWHMAEDFARQASRY